MVIMRFDLIKFRIDVYRLITRKPVTASPEELAANPRARSALLRVVEKL